MTGAELADIRRSLGLSTNQMGRALGYHGPNMHVTVRRYERGERPVPPTIARLAEMFKMHGVPK